MIAPDTDTLAGLLTECTPGPWKAEEKTGPAADWERANIGIWSPHRLAQSTAADEDDDPMNAAWLCGIWGKIEDEDMANARLIALAPELAAEVIALRAQAAKDRARIERLEAALREILNCGQSAEPDHWKFRCMARETARAALEGRE